MLRSESAARPRGGIRATRNNARIRQLSSDPALVAWLHDAGLTLAEAARIQPMYGYESDSDAISSDYATTTAVASLATGGLIAWNISGSGRASGRGILGMVVGGLTFAIGVAKIDETGDVKALGAWNTFVGGTTFALGMTRVLSRDTPKMSEAVAPARPSLAVAPIVGHAQGLAIALSF